MGLYRKVGLLGRLSGHMKARALDCLDRVGMAGCARRQIGQLSGGQQQRICLARALAQDPSLFLLDEPFTGVDVKTEKSIINLLMQLRDEGHTVLVSTHDLASISTFCDRVILLNQTILAAGTTAETFTEENLSMTFGGLPLSSLPSKANQSPEDRTLNQPGHPSVQPMQPVKSDLRGGDV